MHVGITRLVAPAMMLMMPAGASEGQTSSPALVSEPTQPQEARGDRCTIPPGAYTCETFDVEVRDARRDKQIRMRVRVPRAGDGQDVPEGGWPMLVFSHGAGGSRTAFPGLLEFLASHGFASVALTHEDSLLLKRERERAGGQAGRAGARELLSPEGRRELLRSVKLGDRVQDCSFVLDHVEEISRACETKGSPPLRIDASRVAIAGHSAGAFTTQLLAGAKVRAAAVGAGGLRFTTVTDERFKAAVIISGQGTTSRALGEDSWSGIDIPIMAFGGSLDGSPPNMGYETPRSRTEPYTRSRGVASGGPPAYLVYIVGATHGSYQGTAGASELLEEIVEEGARERRVEPSTDLSMIGDATNTSVLLFLRAFLNQDAEARETLDSDELADTIPGKVEYGHK